MCERPALLYAIETWALTVRLKGLLASCYHRTLRYMSRINGRTCTGLLMKRSKEDVCGEH